MSRIADWCNEVRDLVKDNPDLQDKILELKSIDTDFDNALLTSEQANKTITEKDAEISKLKDRCWKLFENQTEVDNTIIETPKAQNNKSEVEIKKFSDFIVND